MSASILSASHLSKVVPGPEGELTLLDAFSLELARGDSLAIVGRSGSGKSTLLGMQLPPNYGERYTRAFAQVYRELAARRAVPLVPFFLEGVGGVPALMQGDGIHPNAAAQPVLLENLWPTLAPLL